jgi:hypothetical protein
MRRNSSGIHPVPSSSTATFSFGCRSNTPWLIIAAIMSKIGRSVCTAMISANGVCFQPTLPVSPHIACCVEYEVSAAWMPTITPASAHRAQKRSYIGSPIE